MFYTTDSMKVICKDDQLLKPGVYCIRCTANGSIYVGSTRNYLGQRFFEHKRRLSSGKSTSPIFQNCWNKYGASSFTFGCIANTEVDDAYEIEQYLIDALNPKLNAMKTVTFSKIKVKHQGMKRLSEMWINKIIECLIFSNCLNKFCDFCKTHAASLFFGIKIKTNLTDEVKKRQSIGAKMAHKLALENGLTIGGRGNKGIPKTETHKTAQSNARIRYVAKMKEAGLWPPTYYASA